MCSCVSEVVRCECDSLSSSDDDVALTGMGWYVVSRLSVVPLVAVDALRLWSVCTLIVSAIGINGKIMIACASVLPS